MASQSHHTVIEILMHKTFLVKSASKASGRRRMVVSPIFGEHSGSPKAEHPSQYEFSRVSVSFIDLSLFIQVAVKVLRVLSQDDNIKEKIHKVRIGAIRLFNDTI
jgi:hypothetical protein